ncbi:unnamed protein product [Mycena citricolor]|uniref:Uncharacterized protein n=1 Tax=Mycena citricolor TaxID=2018698 RepID=A0AAD2H0P4_9AGAR|nr:unnamed protein product [Mycena citricolor]
MFTQLVALTLGALSFASAAPSRQQLFSGGSCAQDVRPASEGFSNVPESGMYEITTPKFGGALLHGFQIGNPLVVSRALLYPGPFGQYELSVTRDNTIRLMHRGHNTAVVVDKDQFISTASTGRATPDEFDLQETDTEGQYVVYSTEHRGYVWTLNPSDSALVSRVTLAPFRGLPSQHFRFRRLDEFVLGLEHLPASTGLRSPAASVFGNFDPISPGRYRIIDGVVGGLVRSYEIGQGAYTSSGRDYPGDFALWDVIGDNNAGYTITNVGQGLPLVLTDSKNLAPIPGLAPARFRFVTLIKGRVSVSLIGVEGVWGLDSSSGYIHASIEIQSQRQGDAKQVFFFSPS